MPTSPRPVLPPPAAGLRRRGLLAGGLLLAAAGGARAADAPGAAADAFEGDPFRSHPWPDMRREFLGARARVQFDERVKVLGPGFAEDPMAVPISVQLGLPRVQRLLVLVDRNPIRRVLELQPLVPLPGLGFRFKLEQGSPVRAAALTDDGVWHVGGTWVDSAGGGCTVPGGTRADGSWTQTLGQVSGRTFATPVPGGDAAARLRLRVMHPMDTGLVNGVPAFYLSRLSLRDAQDRELLRLLPFEPVSENPVFTFDFARRPPGPLRLTGVDNNGNRIDSVLAD